MSGLYSNFSNSTIMNKSKQVVHSKQETKSVVFTYRWQYDLTNLTQPEIIVILHVCQQAAEAVHFSIFWFLKLTKQIKLKFCFYLILRLKPFKQSL